MNILQVQYFCAVAEIGSLSAAANTLFVSQPALSVQIAKLEEELGLQLFARTTTGMALTEAGIQFYNHAGAVIDTWHQFKDSVSNLNGSASNLLRIGLGPRVYSNRLLPLILSFFDENPQYRASFISVPDEDALEALRSELIDIALDRFPPANLVPDFSRFVTHELIREPYCVLTAVNHPISQMEFFHFYDLENYDFIAALPGTMPFKIHQRDFAIAGIHPHMIDCSNSTDVNMMLVRENRGVSIGPVSFADYYGIAAVPFLPPITVALKLFYLRSKSKIPALQAFCAYLSSHLTADSDAAEVQRRRSNIEV